jgi:hypothetical protein
LPGAAQPSLAPQGERSEQPDKLARAIDGPAWGLIATGIAACCFWGFDLLHHARNYLPDHPSNPHPIRWILEAGALAAGVLLIVAGDCMRRRLGYHFVRAASILALVPSSLAALVGIPMGIWALLTLRRPDVRAAFGQGDVRVEELPRSPAEKDLPPTGPIRRKVHSFVGSIRSLFFGSRADNPGARLDGPIPTRDYQRRDDAESPLP